MDYKRYALVTGAGTGIGRGVSKVLAQHGYHVVFHYNRSQQTAEEAVNEVIANGGSAELIQADVSKKADIDRMFSEYKERFDRLDLFVNNSGITRGAHILNMTEEIFDDICNINWKGAYFCIQGAGRIMAEQADGGNIVSISSNHAVTQFVDSSAYGSMKSALVKFTRHAAIELAQYKIRVNTIAPGWTDIGASDQFKAKISKEIPMKRWCTPEDVGHMIMFLDSPHAMSITGNCIVMDGGVQLFSAHPERYGL